jgi:hypothetical protein
MTDLNDGINPEESQDNTAPVSDAGAEVPADGSQPEDNEYHYVKPESTRLYADAEYVRRGRRHDASALLRSA